MKNTAFLLTLLLLVTNINLIAQKKKSTKTEQSEISKTYDGFFTFYYREKTDKITLEVKNVGKEFLYVSALATGIGSNDIGLDRGQLGGQRVVKFIKAGNKLLLVHVNYDYRAISNNPEEQKAVEEAFAQSVLWGFKIEKAENDSYFLDATDFFIRDAHQVTVWLAQTKQGNYKLDKTRSAFYLPRTKNFPKNSEFEVILTFTGKAEGNYIKSVTPTPGAITVRQHHSFVELPDDNYKARKFDPRAGYFGLSFMDYASPLNEPIRKRFMARHRLEKKDPNAEVSEPVEPIVYYLDRGVPEPIRSALLDGASWWNQAFEAIGYKNAFRVEMLPEGADPLDVRYNVIQWVHRSTRGWSYGSAVIDPRTGEIIKGHVSLGSLRVRQDYLIAEGLLAPYKIGNEIPKEVEDMALARIRQLSAHEVGHTLGLAHNYSASSENLSSVMDYPHPFVELIDGKISLAKAYDAKIGDWDKVSIAYGYQDFPDGTDENKALDGIIAKSLDAGLSFLSDQDARPAGSAHPYAHLWDNGKKAYEELERILQIRQIALKNFGEHTIKSGRPYATLEEVLVPIYFFHRYQIEATSKIIGGLNYRYALRGDEQLVTEMIPPQEQINALNALIMSLQTEQLVLPDSLLKIIPPRALGYYRSNEISKTRTGAVLDALGLAETMADMVLSLVLNSERASRLLQFYARDNRQPGLEMVLDKLLDKLGKKNTAAKGFSVEISRTVNEVLVQHLIKLALDDNATSQVRAVVRYKLLAYKKSLFNLEKKETNHLQKAFYQYLISEISEFENNPGKFKTKNFLTPPAGSPIGTDCFAY